MKKIRQAIKITVISYICLSLFCVNVFADVGSYTGPFPDVPADAPYAEAAAALYEMKIFQGDSKGNFNPNNTITRAETAAIICRLLGVEDEAKAITKSVFSDVPDSYWAVGYIAKAAELGIVNGYGDGTFRPKKPVTYQQIVKMLVCAWGYRETAEQAGAYPNGYLSIADEIGITKGISFTGASNAPRSAVAQFAYKATKTPTAYENGGTSI